MLLPRFLVAVAIVAGSAFPLLSPRAAEAIEPPALGFSDIVKVGPSHYLGVFDKAPSSAWLGLIDATRPNRVEGIPVDWNSLGEPAKPITDMEAICALGPNEYLAAESSDKKKSHRLVRFVLDAFYRKAIVSNVYDGLQFPSEEDRGNFEGLACVDRGSRILLILGERGSNEKKGTLFTGYLEKCQDEPIVFTKAGTVESPESATFRDISALYVDGGRRLWAVAALEGETKAESRSIVYLAGKIDPTDPEKPLKLEEKTEPTCIIPGEKIEGLAPAIGADDLFAATPEDDDASTATILFLDGECRQDLATRGVAEMLGEDAASPEPARPPGEGRGSGERG